METVGPGCEIGTEACGGAHHWARKMQELRFKVKLMASQFVKPYVKGSKNDANDAEAICGAMDNGEQFARGRQMSAALGLTPKQHSSEGGCLCGAQPPERCRSGPCKQDGTHGLGDDAKRYRLPARSGSRLSNYDVTKEHIHRDCQAKPNDGKPVETASAEPEETQVLTARWRKWELARE